MKQEEKTKLTREKIIRAGIEEFGSKGYEAASINAISDSGIAKGLIYHNFENKDDLYLACLKVCFDAFTNALSFSRDSGDYRQYFKTRLDFVKTQRESAAMVLEALINPPGKHLDEISLIRASYDIMNEEWLLKLLDTNRLRDDIDRDSAMKYLSVMQDMFNWYCCNPKFAKEPFENTIALHEEALPKIFEYMLYGILKEA